MRHDPDLIVDNFNARKLGEDGSVLFDGKSLDGMTAHERTRLGLARSFQLPRPFMSMSVADNIRVPLMYTVAARAGHHLSHAELGDRCHDLLSLVFRLGFSALQCVLQANVVEHDGNDKGNHERGTQGH